MRVLLLAPELIPNRGGIGVYIAELIRSLPPEVELTVLTVERDDGPTTIGAGEMEAEFGHRARIHALSTGRDSFLYNASFQAAVLRWMRRHLTTERFDLVHSQHAHMPDVLSRLARGQPPTVRTVHTTIAGQRGGIRIAQGFGGRLEASERWQLLLRPLLDAAEWSILSRRDFTITVSDWMRHALVAQGYRPDRVAVVDLSVDTERFRPVNGQRRTIGSRPGVPVVLFQGRPTVVKGAAILARAIPLILKEVPDAEFAFTGAGGGDFLPLLEGRSEVLPHIRFLGFLPHEELAGTVGSADVSVVPSLYENVPFRLLEAMACGIPPIASAVCGIPEVIRDGHNGLLVRPGSAEELAQAVIRLLQDPQGRRQLGREARRTIEGRFSRTALGAGTFAAYERALGRTGGS